MFLPLLMLIALLAEARAIDFHSLHLQMRLLKTAYISGRKGKFMKSYDKLTFTDDFMFTRILYNNLELCRLILELILGIRILKISACEVQKSIDIRYDSRGVRLDVYVADDEGSVFDIEMQVKAMGDLPKRSRYYHAMIGIDQLRRSRDYSTLKESYVIFICKENLGIEFDEPVYYYRNSCEAHPELKLGDGTHTVFVNACYAGDGVSGEMRDFLDYVRSGRVSGNEESLVRRLDKDVAAAREHKLWEMDYMTFGEKLDEQYREGHANGIKEGVRNTVRKLLEKLSPEEVSSLMDIPLETVVEISGNEV